VRLDVIELVFDDENWMKLGVRGIPPTDVLEVLDGEPRFFVNRRGRRASHVMVGPTLVDVCWSFPSKTGAPGSGAR